MRFYLRHGRKNSHAVLDARLSKKVPAAVRAVLPSHQNPKVRISQAGHGLDQAGKALLFPIIAHDENRERGFGELEFAARFLAKALAASRVEMPHVDCVIE